MALHAIIVAGGRGSRLRDSSPPGTSPKLFLQDATGTTLITHTIHAALDAVAGGASGVGRVVVVGPESIVPPDLRKHVTTVQEDPPLSGPASAVAAGVRTLEAAPGVAGTDTVLLLAADLANPRAALAELLAHRTAGASIDQPGHGGASSTAAPAQPDHGGASSTVAPAQPGHAADSDSDFAQFSHAAGADGGGQPDGLLAVAAGREQYLLSLFNLAAAHRAFAQVGGGSLRRPLLQLSLTRVEVDPSAVADIDTWQDATTHGFH